MTIAQEAASWFAPPAVELSPAPKPGEKAPSCPQLPLPAANGKPTIISFLRHCGCPIAEAAFLNLRTAASKHPDINFIAVSHSDQPSTDRWVESVGDRGNDGANQVEVIVDAERKIYAQWGLGLSSWGHVLSPSGLASVWKLGRERGIWNRPTESGTRWQLSGNWVVDDEGVVRGGGPAERVDEVMDFEEAVGLVKRS
ncbi:hypothetical protein BO70DRAFT_336502 [Aspergillus heteromorphus CBS 117.55]|uniref:Thioredoxin domain-containing protein n=1 Tax=Aspergillus heteromorphus CBS 117.55 TaxID=1448321 RepID=A0A317W8U8_9EURO|nr:uncharacterized protein BO70DRAFT_336502 [Aspergillus heteromorphus CBS 117.55]PWY82161.1 hypothetical protein BO70DRAFT_336502 [Aspergillus heteromorphus CBS 117.55]